VASGTIAQYLCFVSKKARNYIASLTNSCSCSNTIWPLPYYPSDYYSNTMLMTIGLLDKVETCCYIKLLYLIPWLGKEKGCSRRVLLSLLTQYSKTNIASILFKGIKKTSIFIKNWLKSTSY